MTYTFFYQSMYIIDDDTTDIATISVQNTSGLNDLSHYALKI